MPEEDFKAIQEKLCLAKHSSNDSNNKPRRGTLRKLKEAPRGLVNLFVSVSTLVILSAATSP